jgi:4-hydroxy-tetrahydrodipicolinate synthase
VPSLDDYHGIFTPILTPLDADEAPDLASLRALVEYLLAAGVHGIWALGTTGEFAALTAAERSAVLGTVVETVRGRVPVVANISDAATRLAIAHGRAARELGVDAVAATPPYYYPDSQDELIAHYTAIREAVDLPLFIYNIPQTVKVRVEPATAVTLAERAVVAGWKDSQNDLEAFRQTMLEMRARGLPFRGLLGSRHLIDIALAVGGHGGVPATSNVCPRLCVEAYLAARRGDPAAAARWQEGVLAWEYLPRRVVGGGSPTAASLAVMKAVLVEQGVLRSAAVSAPLRPLTDGERAAVAAALPDLPQAVAAAS